MKFSYNWLIKYNAYQKTPNGIPTPEEFAKVLENCGHTIEKITYLDAKENGISENDVVYDISVPRNRPDLMNMSWVSKEMCGVYHLFFREFATYWTDGSKKDISKEVFKETQLLVSTNTKKCRLLSGTIINQIDFKCETDQDIKDRLISCGFQPRNGLEDSINYTLRSNGQPIYMFDLKKMKSKKISANNSYKDGTIVHQGKEYKYSKGDCIIMCEEDVLSVCGVLFNDELIATVDTTSVVVLSAVLNRNEVRMMEEKFNVRNYNSLLASTGSIPQDVVRTPGGVVRTLYNVVEAHDLETTVVYNKCDMTRTFLTYTVEEINQLLGTDFTFKEIQETFENPEMPTNEIGDGRVNTMMPSYRLDTTVNDLAQSLLVYWGCDRIGGSKHES